MGENWDRGCDGCGRGGDVEVEGRVRSGVRLRLDGRWRGSGMRRWSGRDVEREGQWTCYPISFAQYSKVLRSRKLSVRRTGFLLVYIRIFCIS